MDYYLNQGFKLCSNMIAGFKRFDEDYKIEIILYKGGLIESEVAEKLGLPSLNLELFGVSKATSQDPEAEIREFKKQLIEIYEHT